MLRIGAWRQALTWLLLQGSDRIPPSTETLNRCQPRRCDDQRLSLDALVSGRSPRELFRLAAKKIQPGLGCLGEQRRRFEESRVK